MWAPIIAKLVAYFGPFLGKLLTDWLDKLLNHASETLLTNVASNGDEEEDAERLMQAAYLTIPRYQRVRLAVMRRMMVSLPSAVKGKSIEKPEAQALRKLQQAEAMSAMFN